MLFLMFSVVKYFFFSLSLLFYRIIERINIKTGLEAVELDTGSNRWARADGKRTRIHELDTRNEQARGEKPRAYIILPQPSRGGSKSNHGTLSVSLRPLGMGRSWKGLLLVNHVWKHVVCWILATTKVFSGCLVMTDDCLAPHRFSNSC